MWTTSPPAKSSAPICSPINEPSPPHTMCASGAYTTSTHMPRNSTIALNFMRPATEPVIIAEVIMAKAI